MTVFYMDESGFTGADLLHKLQPFQGASALCINPEDARYLIRQHFPKLKALELKFSSLIKRDTNLKPLYELQQDLLANFPCVICVADKRFILILLFVTHAVEPWYHARGENLLRDGRHFLMASMAYFAGPALLGNDFELILRRFQQAMREKTEAAILALIDTIRTVKWTVLSELLGPLATGCPECIGEILDKGTTTDASFIILNALISRTEVMTPGEYRVEHDRSKNLLQYNQHLSRFINCDQPAEFKLSAHASVSYPLKLTEVGQVDSLDSPGVQLCDVLVGGCIRALQDQIRDGKTGFYSPARLYEDHHFIGFKAESDFTRDNVFRKGGQNAEYVDFISKVLSNN
ncbi:DUF3800 domain-containing protein [Pantoea agglomerans]|uniref:DUF3800 domain-containing protein n=1 Tax=Enterobacter agglomerans TaxID=549 RepID=UPI002166A21A|nr:DUF3800 domain-containing protein [Pantoea agglomerans]UVV75374.1 DUF3800 domain-containing protein [Pantoea agglomerans]